tara:strand:- start:22821 stop:25280 length:2460 start_codon:yes stop_codon:yes gene_type:complete
MTHIKYINLVSVCTLIAILLLFFPTQGNSQENKLESIALNNTDPTGSEEAYSSNTPKLKYSDIESSALLPKDNDFDIEAATKELNDLTLKLSIQDVVAKDLEIAAEEISQLKDGALQCVEDNLNAIKKIDTIIPKIDPTKTVTLTPNQQNLIRKRIKAENLVSECKLFGLKADEAITVFIEAAQKIKKTKIFSKSEPLVADLPKIKRYAESWVSTVNLAMISKNTGFDLYQRNEINFLFMILLAGLIAGMILWKSLYAVSCRINIEGHFDTIVLNIILTLKRYSVQVVCLLFLFLFAILGDFYHERTTLMPSLFGVISIYYLCKGLISFCFLPPNPALPYCDISKAVALKLYFRLNLFLGICLVCALAFLMLYDAYTNQKFYALVSGVIMTLLACNIFTILWVINGAPKFLSQHKLLRGVFSTIITLVLVGTILCQWFGYQPLASYLLFSTTYSILSLFGIWFLYSVFSNSLDSFTSRRYKWEKDLQKFLQITEGETPIEITLLRLFGFLLFWSSILLISNEIWSLSEWWSYRINKGFFEGFVIADSKVMPFRIILSLFVLAIGMLSIRAVKQFMNSKIEGSRSAQEAHIMILSYVFYTAILLFSLVVAGVNLGGLALVAGALSVGIGFGLQSIVNNFVSGLILLLERPIKKGDRIIVGDKEGFVAKIGVRSTRVNTIEKTDVIVPNAELIGNQVTNFMYNNKRWLVVVKVGVEYGSDIELVKSLLLKVALDHPNIVQDGHEAPAVFFMNFGDSALDFELWAVSKNVNEKFFVLTDLNSEIDRSFKEHNIVISFPQTDLHIKDSVAIPMAQKKGDEAET